MANVNVLTNTVVAAGVDVLPVKFNVLNQLLVVIVGIPEPAFINRLGALVADPPVVPNTKVLATAMIELNPPAPDTVKFVASAIDSTVVAAVSDDSAMKFPPKLIALVPVPVEEKIPVLTEFPFNTNVPAVNVMVLVEPVVKVAPRLNVPPTPENVIGKSTVLDMVIVLALALVLAKVVVFALEDTVPPVASML